MTLEWTNDSPGANDVRERRFVLSVEAETISGVLWAPRQSGSETPLVLAGHGYGMDKLRLYPDTLGSDLAQRGCAVAAIDLPLHGERRPSQSDRTSVDTMWTAYWREFGASRIAAEFCVLARALDAAGAADGSRVAYWGLSLGRSTASAWSLNVCGPAQQCWVCSVWLIPGGGCVGTRGV